MITFDYSICKLWFEKVSFSKEFMKVGENIKSILYILNILWFRDKYTTSKSSIENIFLEEVFFDLNKE